MITQGDSAEVSLAKLMQHEACDRLALCRGIAPKSLAEQCIAQLQELAMQDLQCAIDASTWVIERADATNDGPLRVAARTATAFALSMGNRFQEAMQLLDVAGELASTLDPALQGRVAQARVQPLARLGRLTEATAAAEQAIARFEQADQFMMAAKARANLGIVLRMREQPAAALRAFDQALKYLADQPGAVAQLQNNRAEALLELANFAEAESAFRAAMQAFADGGVHRAAAIAEGNLADLLGMQGKIADALRHFEHARRSLEDGQSPGDAARLATERAEVMSAVGLPSEAVDVCLASINVLDEAGLTNEAARARLAAAVALLRSNRIEEARAHVSDAATQFAAQGATRALAKANVLLAQIERSRGHSDRALAILVDACKTLRQWPNEHVRASTLLVSVLVDVGQDQEAMQQIERLLPEVDRLGFIPLRADLLHVRAKIMADLGDLDQAIATLQQAIEDVERLRGLLQADRLRAAWLGDRMDAYTDLVAMHLRRRDATDLASAFQLLEQVRSRSLLDLMEGNIELAQGFLSQEADHGLVQRLASNRAELNAIYSAMDRQDGISENQAGAHRIRMRALERELATIEGQLAATRQFAPIFATPIDLRTVQATLAAKSGILSYFRAGNSFGAFVVRNDRVHVIPDLCSVQRTDSMIQRLVFQLNRSIAESTQTERAKNRIDRELLALHDLLVEPIKEVLAGLDCITILPDGSMFGLPFGLLLNREGYLLERFVLSIAPSASIAHRMLSTQRELRDGAAIVLAVPDALAPQIATEALSVTARLPGAQLITGDEATAQHLIESVPGASHIHLACHGQFSATDPLESRFKLADRWLTAREILGMDLHGTNVFLSCCDVGRNRVAPGAEIFGLTRVMLANGVSALVTSLWPAHDQVTSELVDVFYEHLAKGESVVRALASAQRCYATGTASPAHWGHFVAVGMAS